MPERTSAEEGLKGGYANLQEVVNANYHSGIAEGEGEVENGQELPRHGRKLDSFNLCLGLWDMSNTMGAKKPQSQTVDCGPARI